MSRTLVRSMGSGSPQLIVAGAIGDRRMGETQVGRRQDGGGRPRIAAARQNVENDIGGMDTLAERLAAGRLDLGQARMPHERSSEPDSRSPRVPDQLYYQRMARPVREGFCRDWRLIQSASTYPASRSFLRPRWRYAHSGPHKTLGVFCAVVLARLPERRSTVRPSRCSPSRKLWWRNVSASADPLRRRSQARTAWRRVGRP